jgi:hypothetical protein
MSGEGKRRVENEKREEEKVADFGSDAAGNISAK